MEIKGTRMFDNAIINFCRRNIIPIMSIIVIVLIGYYRIFFGSSIFLYPDQIVNSEWTFGNSLGNGWRPDKGFGLSFFFGDPGAFHAWSVLSFWDALFSSREIAYQSSVLILDMLSATAVYYLLRRVVPSFGRWVCLLAPLVIFTMSQDSFHFNRVPISSIAGVSLLLVFLYDYYESSRPKYLFYGTLLFFYVLFLGSFLTFTVVPTLGATFTVLYCIYNKKGFRKIFSKFFIFHATCGIVTILLGFWVFYSIFFELSIFEFVREKNYTFSFGILPTVSSVVQYILNLLQFYSIPTNINLLGVGWRPFYHSFNMLAIFPIVFIYFLFYKPSTFWEFSLKWLMLIFYISKTLSLIPAVNSTISIISISSRYFINFYGISWEIFVFPVQLSLVAIYFGKIRDANYEINQNWGRRIQIGVGVVLLLYFLGFTVFSLLSLVLPDRLLEAVLWVVDGFGPDSMGLYTKEMMMFAAKTNIEALMSSMHWYSLIFYLMTTGLIVQLLIPKGLSIYTGNKIYLLFAFVLVSGIFYSWTVYPLSKEKSVWTEIAYDLPEFKATDRFYYVDNTKISLKNLTQKQCEQKFREVRDEIEGAGSSYNYLQIRRDHFASPGLRLHGAKSFTQKMVSDYFYKTFNGDGINRVDSLRELFYGGPLISSQLLDMGAVTYYFSKKELKDLPDNLSLYFKREPIYIYKNKNAWPYYYLADQLKILNEGQHPENIKKGTAYISSKDYFHLSGGYDSTIELVDFKYGEMVFDYNGANENLLVVADTWHPFWKAKIGDEMLPLFRANDIFKAVRLRPGQYRVKLSFDTSPYLLGVYVSIVAWICFLASLFYVIFRSKDQNKTLRKLVQDSIRP